jgi:hypothetical protein
MRTSFKALLLGCLVALTSTAGAADYLLNPLKMEVKIPDKGLVISNFVVQNASDKVIKLETHVKSWTQSENGAVLLTDSPENFNVEESVKLNPEQFELKPHQTKMIRFAVKASPELPVGEYRFQIGFTQPEALQPEMSQVVVNNDKSFSVSIPIRTGFALSVYAFKGTPKPHLTISDFQCAFDPEKGLMKPHAKILNDGTRHALIKATLVVNAKDPTGKFKPMSVNHLENDRTVVIVPTVSRTLQAAIGSGGQGHFAPGEYQSELVLTDTLEQMPVVSGTCNVVVPAERL